MSKKKYTEREIWTGGRKGCNALVTATIYPDSIVATADPERITEFQIVRTLRRHFPTHTFYREGDGGDYMRLQADRWTNDGVENDDEREADK